MAVALDPPDLLDQAAREEGWTASDRGHAEKIVTDAFDRAFKVKLIQQTSIGLCAYDAEFVNFESVLFQDAAKPVLNALEDLSRKLLRLKHEFGD